MFKEFKKEVNTQFQTMAATGKLFTVDVDKGEMWNTYQDSFPAGTNEIFRERREHDCVCCKQYIRRLGHVVTINPHNMELITIWDSVTVSPYNEVAKALSDLIKSKVIKNRFLIEEKVAGTDHNWESEDQRWEHLCSVIPEQFQYFDKSESLATKLSYSQAAFQTFERAVRELTVEASDMFLELTAQGSVYRGEEFVNKVRDFKIFQREYNARTDKPGLLNWCWLAAGSTTGACMHGIRNSALGTILQDFSEGELSVSESIRKFGKVMDPANYKHPETIYTKKMVEEQKAVIVELGLEPALYRRHATMDDVSLENVWYIDRKVKAAKETGIFADLSSGAVAASPKNKNFDKVEKVSIEKFLKDIMPNALSVELMVDPRHRGNVVNLIAPVNADAGRITLWDNNHTWAYSGNTTDSRMKDTVKKVGGDVTGVLRYSISWNEDGKNGSDFDAHALEPGGNLISYQCRRNARTRGVLDYDHTNPGKEYVVENITWPELAKLDSGVYEFHVHNYSLMGSGQGFKAELEFNDTVYCFEYKGVLKNNAKVLVAKVRLDKEAGTLTIIDSLPFESDTQPFAGLTPNEFVRVDSVMLSPNYWDEQTGKGNKHYFFFLDGCVSEETPRGFFNEYLRHDLIKHKRAFQALGQMMVVPDSDQQLAGLGFSSTKRNSVIARVKGASTRVVEINF